VVLPCGTGVIGLRRCEVDGAPEDDLANCGELCPGSPPPSPVGLALVRFEGVVGIGPTGWRAR